MHPQKSRCCGFQESSWLIKLSCKKTCEGVGLSNSITYFLVLVVASFTSWSEHHCRDDFRAATSKRPYPCLPLFLAATLYSTSKGQNNIHVNMTINSATAVWCLTTSWIHFHAQDTRRRPHQISIISALFTGWCPGLYRASLISSSAKEHHLAKYLSSQSNI